MITRVDSQGCPRKKIPLSNFSCFETVLQKSKIQITLRQNEFFQSRFPSKQKYFFQIEVIISAS